MHSSLLGQVKGNYPLPAHLKQRHIRRPRSTASSPSVTHEFRSAPSLLSAGYLGVPQGLATILGPDLQAPQHGPRLPGEDLSGNQALTLGNPIPEPKSYREPNDPSPRVSLTLWRAPRENFTSSESNTAFSCCQNTFYECGAQCSLPPKPKASSYWLCSTQPPWGGIPKTSLSPSPKPHISTSGEGRH